MFLILLKIDIILEEQMKTQTERQTNKQKDKQT